MHGEEVGSVSKRGEEVGSVSKRRAVRGGSKQLDSAPGSKGRISRWRE